MRLFNGLALAGLAGLAVGATQEPAEVYILTTNPSESRSSSSTPKDQLPRQLARDILFQRLMIDDRLSSDIVGDKTLEYISKYGRTTKPLFGAEGIAPSQLVVLLEGVTEDNAVSLKKELQNEPAFKILDAPSAKANKHLVDVEFAATGTSGSCDIAAAINPYDSCWNGMSLIVKYDITKVCHHQELYRIISDRTSVLTPPRTPLSSSPSSTVSRAFSRLSPPAPWRRPLSWSPSPPAPQNTPTGRTAPPPTFVVDFSRSPPSPTPRPRRSPPPRPAGPSNSPTTPASPPRR